MTPANPDQPDSHLGRQDPFVHALTIWRSLEALRAHGSPRGHLEDVGRSMDGILVRHRRKLVEQYEAASSGAPQDPAVLRRELGLEYWSDGELLAQNDPERRTT